MAFSLAFTLGPMLGASLPVETAPWLALLFAVSDLLFICCFLPETLPPEKRVRWEPDRHRGSLPGPAGRPVAGPGAGEAELPASGVQTLLGPQRLLGPLRSPDPLHLQSLAGGLRAGPARALQGAGAKQVRVKPPTPGCEAWGRHQPRRRLLNPVPPRHRPSRWGSELLLTCSALWPCSASQPWHVARTRPPESVRSRPPLVRVGLWLPRAAQRPPPAARGPLSADVPFRCSAGLGSLRLLGLVYFLYLFLFSGLEFTLSFLVHQRFQFSRWECGAPARTLPGHALPSPHPEAPQPCCFRADSHLGLSPGAQPGIPGRAVPRAEDG